MRFLLIDFIFFSILFYFLERQQLHRNLPNRYFLSTSISKFNR